MVFNPQTDCAHLLRQFHPVRDSGDTCRREDSLGKIKKQVNKENQNSDKAEQSRVKIYIYIYMTHSKTCKKV